MERRRRRHRPRVQGFLPLFFWKRDSKAGTSSLFTALGGYTSDDTAGTFARLHPAAADVLAPRADERVQLHHAALREPLLEDRAFDDPLVGAALLPARGSRRARPPRCSRCSGVSTTPPPARPRRSLPLGGYRSGPRDDTTVVAQFFWRDYKPSGWSAGLFPLLFFGNKPGGSHAVVFPLFWHFADRDGIDDRAGAPLLLAPRPRRLRASALPLLFVGNDRGDSYAIQFPLIWHFASERRGTSTTATPGRLLPHAIRDGWSMGVGPLRAPAVRALRQDALALRAGAAVLALRRSHRRQDDDGRRPVLAPPLGQRDHRRPVPAALLPARRAPGRQRRDQLHALPAGPLPARRADTASS